MKTACGFWARLAILICWIPTGIWWTWRWKCNDNVASFLDYYGHRGGIKSEVRWDLCFDCKKIVNVHIELWWPSAGGFRILMEGNLLANWPFCILINLEVLEWCWNLRVIFKCLCRDFWTGFNLCNLIWNLQLYICNRVLLNWYVVRFWCYFFPNLDPISSVNPMHFSVFVCERESTDCENWGTGRIICGGRWLKIMRFTKCTSKIDCSLKFCISNRGV